jgi:hypothetical protein
MPITEQTLLEMEAGAKALAKQRGQDTLPPGYMEAIIRTHERHLQLKSWEAAGRIRIVRMLDDENMRNLHGRAAHYTIVRIGSQLRFDDRNSETEGGWPSELFMAQIALALEANQDKT